MAVVIALGGVLALAVAGATIEDLRSETDGDGPAGGEGSGGLPEPDGAMPEQDIVSLVPPELVILILATLLGIVFAIYVLREWREALPHLLLGIAVIVALMVLFHLIPWDPDFTPIQEEFDYDEIAAGDETEGGGGGSESPPVIGEWFPMFLLLGGFAVLVVAVTVLASRDGSAEPASATEDPAPSRPDRSADIGAAAGRAADRLEAEEGLENEVYRAWVEMVELLEVGDPQSATPRGFAREATRAGVEPDDVADLTELFEEVRYGDRPPTEEREREAVELLRRIEDRYAAGDDA